MKKIFFLLAITFIAKQLYSQDTSKSWTVAFPITDYMVGDSDTIRIVQVQIPAAVLTIPINQLGLLRGIYRDGNSDTATVGYGRCQLIKGDYYYFGIRCYNKIRLPKKGDLIYTKLNKVDIYYGRLPKLAAHSITLQKVDETNLYDPLVVISSWTKQSETDMIASLIEDIKYTAGIMEDQSPTMNRKISSGPYKDKMLFDVMQHAQQTDVEEFLDYVNARPANYAGNSWKVSEIFATWVDAGAPMVRKS